MKSRADGALVAASATIGICTQPANTTTQPCSPLATLYTDATLATPCTGTLKDGSVAGATNCSNPLVTDARGNYHFYASGTSVYTVQVYGSGLTTSVEPDVSVGGSLTTVQPVSGTTGTFTGAVSTGALTVTSLNAEPILASPPSGTTIAMGTFDPAVITSMSCCTTGLLVGTDYLGGTYRAGNTGLWARSSYTGTVNVGGAWDGGAAQADVLGTVTMPITQLGGALNGFEADSGINGTGAQFSYGTAYTGGVSGFTGTDAFTYWTAYRAQPNNNVGSFTGTVTGNFAFIAEPGTYGTINAGIWNKGQHLIANGNGIGWFAAPTTTTSATMTGCPSACLVTVTDTSHGYSTNDFVWVQSGSRQYEGFYKITNTGANTFTYPAIQNYASNAANDGSVQVSKLPLGVTGTHIAVDANNSMVFNNPYCTNCTNGVFQFEAQGTRVLCLLGAVWTVDCGGTGYALKIPSSSQFIMGGGSAAIFTGSTGGNGNIVSDQSPTINGIVSMPGNKVTLAADWTCGTTGTVSSCVAATIIGSGGGVPLTFTLPLVAANYKLECDLVVGQATAASSNQWNLLTATNGATNVTANYVMGTAATAMAVGAVTDQASTTSTFQIAPNWTLGGTGTKMPVHIYADIQGASASGTVLSLQVLAPTVADLLTIYRGSGCRIY